MKKSILFLLLFLLKPGIFTIHAQESDLQRGSLHPGYIITLKGDTIHGYLLNINLWLNQFQTYLYTDTLDKKGRVKYTTKEIREYQVGNRHYVSMKYPFSYSSKKQSFILQKQKGAIDLYVWYYDEDRYKLSSPNITLTDLGQALLFNEKDLWKNQYIEKKDGKFTPIGFKFLLKFAKNMSAYVADEPELAEKILNKQEGYLGIDRDIENIVIEYNKLKSSE